MAQLLTVLALIACLSATQGASLRTSDKTIRDLIEALGSIHHEDTRRSIADGKVIGVAEVAGTKVTTNFDGNGKTIILNDEFPEAGKVTTISFEAGKQNIFFVEIWRPMGGATFQRLYEVEVNTDDSAVPEGYDIDVSGKGWNVEAGDRLALKVQEGSLPVAYYEETSEDFYCADDDIPKLTDFTIEKYNYRFLVAAVYE